MVTTTAEKISPRVSHQLNTEAWLPAESRQSSSDPRVAADAANVGVKVLVDVT